MKKSANEPYGLSLEDTKSTISINDSEYLYSILKLDKEEGIKIKLYEATPKTNIYYEYEGLTSELTKNIKILLLCENLDEMITTLKSSFNEGKAKFIEKEEKYYIELTFEAMGKSKTSLIQFIKYEPKDPMTEMNDKIKTIENECKNLSKEIEKLKNMKDNDEDLKEKIKAILQEKDIKMMLFEEFEKIICSKYNLDNNNKKDDKKEDLEKNLSKVENSLKDLMNNELKEKVNGKEFNEKIKNIEEQLFKESNDLDNIKNNLENLKNNYVDKTNLIPQLDENIQNNKLIKKISDEINSLKIEKNNYIELKLKACKEEKIYFINQCSTYKYFYNFERDDIEVIVDGENVSLDILKRDEEFQSSENSSNCFIAQRLSYNLQKEFCYYWIFKTEGIHTIKIIFRKKLFDCSRLFSRCSEIIEIDLSNFDCSQVTSCESMFCDCLSLKKLNLGTLDFGLSKKFKDMFAHCINLEELDVSDFNTKNSMSFERMFYYCSKLKKIDVSKFNSSKCKKISRMFEGCQNISEINMINWDMSSLYKNRPIDNLFYRCKMLKMIKMSSNFNDIDIRDQGGFLWNKKDEIFEGLPEGGKFYWKKGINCNKLLNVLPVSWNREQE